MSLGHLEDDEQSKLNKQNKKAVQSVQVLYAKPL